MRNIKLVLQYDGSAFYGWQRQPHFRTAEGVLKEAIERLFSKPVKLYSASRLDRGAHAVGQVVNFFANTEIPISSIPAALNSLLPQDIKVREAEEVSSSFHARYSARSRTYLYKILNEKNSSVFLRNYALWVPHSLCLKKMQECAKFFLGKHDFSSLIHKEGKMERVIMESTFYKEGELLLYRVKGNAFLPHMIRCMVSLLLGVGMGRFPPSLIEQVLKGERASFNPVAAFGLYLLQVDYGD